MKTIKCNQPTFFDVDDTLVMWGSVTDPEEQKKAIPITCPISKTVKVVEDMMGEPTDEEIEVPSWTEYLRPHEKHIEMLKQHKLRGHTIIVWSQGGWEWAEAVVKALKIEKYVDVVMEKPMWFYDDLPASRFMEESKRIYKPYKEPENE